MGYEDGELKTMQSGKEIDLSTTVPAMIDVYNALRQSKDGLIPGKDVEFTDNQRILNQVKGLSKLISSQETIITLASAQVEYRSRQKWLKKNKLKEEKDKNPFEEEGKEIFEMEYDFNKLAYWNNFLHSCRLEILKAEKSANKSDDFMVKEDYNGEEIHRLTENFWQMLKDLQTCFTNIHRILMVNKVIASGVEENEELSYKEQEQLFIQRVKDA